MAKNRSDDPLRKVSFVCPVCRHKFSAQPARVEDAEDRPWHPWAYVAPCPLCKSESDQAQWEVNLLKAHANATGPKTPEGKAASSSNLDGHPTPEEARLTRFNAMKHGLFARTATYFPAKPGSYPQCEGCEHLEDESCVPQRACLKRAELFMRHQVAFETKDPELLMQLRGDTQAAIQALINDMILAIAQDGGPRLISPEWYYDKEGHFHLAGWTDKATGEFHQISKYEAHPLLKHLMDFINKNRMTLEDLEMTPKVQTDQDMVQGYLDKQGEEQESADDYRQRIEQQNNKLLELIEKGQRRQEERVIDGEVVRGE